MHFAEKRIRDWGGSILGWKNIPANSTNHLLIYVKDAEYHSISFTLSDLEDNNYFEAIRCDELLNGKIQKK
jgi:hypothetical protein